MSKILEADWDQQYLLPASIEDWVAEDHPARFVRSFVESCDLKSLDFSMPKESPEGGRPSYSVDLLLRAWLYGYIRKIRSSRGLEIACKEQMGFIWLCGTLKPDHNTLWRFWRANRKAIRNVFLQTLKVANELKMIGFILQAVDGTKIQAVCSSRGAHGKDGLKKLLEKAKANIEELEGSISKNGEQSGVDETLPKELHKQKDLRDRIESALKKIESSDAKYINPQEPESRRMNTEKPKGNKFGYNAQAMVDDQNGIITAADVCNENNDFGELNKMIDQSSNNTGKDCELTLADGGYSCGKEIEQAQQQQRAVIMPLPSSTKNPLDKPYHSEKFKYDAQQNRVICPQGQCLHYSRSREKKGVLLKLYQNSKACRNCGVRSKCTQAKRGRCIEIAPWHENVIEHRKLMQKDSSKQTYKKRAGIVEPLFAWIKINDQMRRWSYKGLENVKSQWLWLCCARNLKVIYQYLQTQRMSAC